MTTPLKLGEPRTLGSLGEVGPLSIGCWRLTGSDSNNSSVISAAVDAGMNLVDNADVYGLDWGGTHFGACEEALGRVLATTPGLRDRIVLATKGGIIPGVPYDSSSAYLVSACEASLSRMGVDHVDLYQIHRPDHFTHPQEIASAFASLHSRGLVRDFGVSNYTATQTLALNSFVENGLVSVQPQFSAIHLDPMRDGIFDLCQEAALTPLAWSPLAGGALATGTGVRMELVKVLDDLALREGVTRAAVAIAFVLAHPSQPVAIIGTQNANRIAELALATTISLSRTDVYSIVQASDARPLP
ncbi:MAG: hypothetical protein RL688_1127 [Actinomycetota bacterium]|jgi:predicted oxidoreductase